MPKQSKRFSLPWKDSTIGLVVSGIFKVVVVVELGWVEVLLVVVVVVVVSLVVEVVVMVVVGGTLKTKQ